MKTAVLLVSLALAAAAQHTLDQYNVTWDSPSRDSSGSMPLGNGDIGLNVWVEESGDLVFYLSKTDAWSETVRLLKLGRVRVRLSPNPFKPGQAFRQTLNLRTANVEIRMGPPATEVRLNIWADANYPVVRVEAETARPTEMQVIYERWRDQQRRLDGDEAQSAYGLENGPEPLISFGDSIVLDAGNTVTWYHRNSKSAWSGIWRHQGLGGIAGTFTDPLLNRTFGAAMRGDGMARINPTTLRSQKPSQQHVATITALTAIAGSSEEWVRQVTAQLNKMLTLTVDGNRDGHERWWSEFWNRSYIRITQGPEAFKVTRAYALQRFVNACAGRGAYPIKFNGSIFTVDAKVNDVTLDADYRRWGGPYWFQNTRLIYWPMLASGDFDLMQPLFRMYCEAQPMAQQRTKLYFKHDGAFFPETMYFFGAYANTNYGWKREGRPPSFVENTYIRHYFSGALELLAMMLDYVSYSGDKNFARSTLAFIAEDIIEFYDKHYERDSNGRMKIAPAQALETWQDVVNPLPEIAGLRYVLNGLLAAKTPISKNAQNTARRMLLQLPAVPSGDVKGVKVLLPAERLLGEIKNRENPELYAIFPYKLYGLDRQDLELARNTFDARRHKQTGGWQQDAVQAALLGLSDVAQKYVIENLTAKSDQRFPGFWGPNFDWTPDQCHGNVAMLALQSMLLQSNGDRLLVGHAWPGNWTVEFKLWAPQNTAVEGVIRDGKIEKLKVTPNNRNSDVVRPPAQS
jgi:hypothetical protein